MERARSVRASEQGSGWGRSWFEAGGGKWRPRRVDLNVGHTPQRSLLRSHYSSTRAAGRPSCRRERRARATAGRSRRRPSSASGTWRRQSGRSDPTPWTAAAWSSRRSAGGEGEGREGRQRRERFTSRKVARRTQRRQPRWNLVREGACGAGRVSCDPSRSGRRARATVGLTCGRAQSPARHGRPSCCTHRTTRWRPRPSTRPSPPAPRRTARRRAGCRP